jgi:predicted acetyltransferase
VYWISLLDEKPYALIMTIQEYLAEERAKIKDDHLSKSGKTYGIDYMIGDKNYFGKGLGAKTLAMFTEFFQQEVDRYADTFFIDPDENNPRAKHVYEKAGFECVGDFIMEGEGVFAGRKTYLLVKKIPPIIDIIAATINDYPIIQNMVRYYGYDFTRSCGFISEDWAIMPNGLYDCFDFKKYFIEPSRKAFLVKVNQELAGFVLLNHDGKYPETEWKMGEFFILAKFQGKGIGSHVAYKIWTEHPGLWEVSIIPENRPGLAFWRNTISRFTSGHYEEEVKRVDFDRNQPHRIIFRLDTRLNHGI